MLEMRACLLGLALFAGSGQRPGHTYAAEVTEQFETTVKLYFSANADYQPGDLLTQSHLEDLQTYLRRTQRNSPAVHPKWRKQMLADRAHLARLFYHGGAKVLRQAAKELGGYAGLDQLTRDSLGRKLIQEAIKQKSPEILISKVSAVRAAEQAKKQDPSKKVAVLSHQLRIYTADDFLKAVAVETSKLGQSRPSSKQSPNVDSP